MIIPQDDHDQEEIQKFERSLFPEESELLKTKNKDLAEGH